MESNDPTDPIESTEFFEQIDSSEFVDRIDHRDEPAGASEFFTNLILAHDRLRVERQREHGARALEASYEDPAALGSMR